MQNPFGELVGTLYVSQLILLLAKLGLSMWIPGTLPPNIVFLITVSQPSVGESKWLPLYGSHARDSVAADTTDQTAHLQDAERRKHAMHRQTAGLGDVVNQ